MNLWDKMRELAPEVGWVAKGDTLMAPTVSIATPVGSKTYLRRATVIMACHQYNAAAPAHFSATWRRRWYGYRLTIREMF